jgi:hypothetical protein
MGLDSKLRRYSNPGGRRNDPSPCRHFKTTDKKDLIFIASDFNYVKLEHCHVDEHKGRKTWQLGKQIHQPLNP